MGDDVGNDVLNIRHQSWKIHSKQMVDRKSEQADKEIANPYGIIFKFWEQ
jgi:hypothetical protein